MARKADYPASRLIRFLSAYGPSERNANLYDEFVVESARKQGIPPIELEAEFVDDIVGRLRDPRPVNVLVAGVAGDGKSYHLRKVWSALGGDAALWNAPGDPSIPQTLADGTVRRVQFVKDLSALPEEDFPDLWRRMNADGDSPECFVIACNHGQILSRLNALEDAGARRCAQDLEARFFRAERQQESGRTALFDLSRADQSKKLLGLIGRIARLDGWKACTAPERPCPFAERCPIRRNLARLWDPETNRPGIAAGRLALLVSTSSKDGFHFPLRELFVLAVNAFLGASGNSNPLGSCHVVARMLAGKPKAGLSMDLTENLLGMNLSAAAREKQSVFRRLAHFEIGSRGDPVFDAFALLGRQSPDEAVRTNWESLLGDLPPVKPQTDRQEEASGPSIRTDGRETVTRDAFLAIARRRLFFTWEGDGSGSDVWRLTGFRHVRSWTSLDGAARTGIVPEIVIRGLTRIFTGHSDTDPNSITISTNGAQSRTAVGELVVAQLQAGRKRLRQVSLCTDGMPDSVPVLVIEPQGSGQDPRIEFALTPRRFEYICGVAEGILPTSFPNQCQAEFHALKARIIRGALEDPDENPTPGEITFDLVDGPINCTLSSNAGDTTP